MREKLPLYMMQFSYTHEYWGALIKKPEDRVKAAVETSKALGGRVVTGGYHFGEFDSTMIIELPDDVTASAYMMAAASLGYVKATKTTRLYSAEETIEALQKVGKLPAYHQPTGLQ
jgi:uncharacterized protein with GYD domain